MTMGQDSMPLFKIKDQGICCHAKGQDPRTRVKIQGQRSKSKTKSPEPWPRINPRPIKVQISQNLDVFDLNIESFPEKL